MEMLRVLVLAVLGWSLGDGRYVSECELMKDLRSAAASDPAGSGLDQNVLARGESFYLDQGGRDVSDQETSNKVDFPTFASDMMHLHLHHRGQISRAGKSCTE